MKVHSIIFCTFLFLVLSAPMAAQEFKNLKEYKAATGKTSLEEGCWLRADRKTHNEVWKKANVYNLSQENGNLKYKTLSEMCDFYLWFDQERKKQGHEIKWIGIAQIVANQLSNLDLWFVREIIVSDKEVEGFAHEGCEKVLAYAFPKLKAVYFSKEILKGKAAEEWDREYGMGEQCMVLEPIYKRLSDEAICKLDKMAKGKGIYFLAVPKKIRFVGSIEDCEARFRHGRDRLSLKLNGK